MLIAASWYITEIGGYGFRARSGACHPAALRADRVARLGTTMARARQNAMKTLEVSTVSGKAGEWKLGQWPTWQIKFKENALFTIG
jgi:hypothetical protein